ncbi:MAG TPA: alpha-ketoglutarate-dependent dioxygenase AlkB [Cellvibrionaceae bacterium]
MQQTGLFDQPLDPSEPERLIETDGEALLYRQWLSAERAATLFTHIEHELAWQQTELSLFGRPCLIPRLNAWYGDSGAAYSYSGARFEPHPWTPSLTALRQALEAFSSHPFNSVLANFYRHGNDGVAWHSDNEPELGREPVIASISLGATRRFRLRHTHLPTVAVDLQAGDLLIMQGPLQHHWQHALTKTRRAVGARINLTFRHVTGC